MTMTDDRTVLPDGDRPTLPELPTTVVATLPDCPDWCGRSHFGWGVPPSDSIIHAKTVGGEIKVRGDSILELAVVAVTVEMHDYIDGAEVLRTTPVLRVGEAEWQLTAGEARQLAGMLEGAASELERVLAKMTDKT